MRENLLSPTNITLFGRVFPLQVDTDKIPDTLGANRFLRAQLLHEKGDDATKARFARIFAISYEGTFYHLSRPAVFLVHSEGKQIHGAGLPSRGAKEGGQTDDTGLIAEDFVFERSDQGNGANDLEAGQSVRYWEYDKGDFSLRLDIASGTFEEILLEAEVDAQMQMSSAARMQSAGSARMQISHAARMQVSRRSGS